MLNVLFETIETHLALKLPLQFSAVARRIAIISIATTIGAAIAPHAIAQTTSPPSSALQLAQATPSLSGSWRLANMTAGDFPTPMLPAGEEPLTAEFAGDRLTGSGGCNRFTGGFETTGNQLTVGPLATTFMACEPEIMNQESQYLNALQGAQQYDLDDEGNLTITYQTEEGGGVLRFVPQGIRALW